MGRLDWKAGRFNSDYETFEIHGGLRGHHASQVGDRVDWYRFESESSAVHDIYDEGVGVGRVFREMRNVPVLKAIRVEGDNLNTETGFYYNDGLHVTASFRQMAHLGFRGIDVSHWDYLKDRVVYDGQVFRVTDVQVLGQIRRRDIIVSVESTQVRDDEMVYDSQFKAFLTP